MGHLVKIQNYNTRYEQDFFQYPNHITAVKKAEWDKLVEMYEKKDEINIAEIVEDTNKWNFRSDRKKKFSIFPLLKKKKWQINDEEIEKINQKEQKHHIINISINNISSKEQLKLLFQEEWYCYQILLACRYSENETKRFLYNLELKQLMQNFSDQYLIYYKPDIQLEDSVVEICTTIITPLEIIIVNELIGTKDAVYTSNNKRYWMEISGETKRRIVNPTVSLNRSEKIIRNILKNRKLDMPIQKVILCKKGYIDTTEMPSGFEYIDNKNAIEWYKKKNHSSIPLKSMQLKVGEAILNQTSNSFKGA